MAITRFEDLPSTNSPIISENLNGNFDELGVKVGTSVDNNYRVNILFQGGNILPKGTIHNLTSGSVALNFKVPKANTQYTMKSNIPAGEVAVVFFGSGADATVTTSNNGVSSTTPRTMTSDSNGYVTIAFRYHSEAGSQRNLDLYWYTIAEGTTGIDYIEPSINVDGEEIYSKPVVLFNNANGLFDDITLTDSKSNYSKLEIYFIDDQNFQNTMTIDASNNPFQLQFVKSGGSKGSMYFMATRFSYSGNTIKRGTTTIYNIINGVITENTTADVLKITKIIGYKY